MTLRLVLKKKFPVGLDCCIIWPSDRSPQDYQWHQGCHLMKSKKRKTRLKIRKKAEREIEKADKKAEIYILTRFYDF